MEHVVFIEASLTGSGEKSIQYAREAGKNVTLVCKDDAGYPASIKGHANQLIKADTNDARSIIDVLKILNGRNRIDAILTTNDFFVVQTAKAAEHFCLPTTSSSDAEKIKNKYLMRMALAEISPDLNPGFTLAGNIRQALEFANSYGYPLIAKPQDANDSLYVQKINDDKDMENYFLARERWGKNHVGQAFAGGVLLEELVGGQEYCLDVLQIWNGDMITMGAFRKELAGAKTGNFIKIGANFPSAPQETERLRGPISDALQKLGIRVGAVNVDCKIVGDAIKIIEINQRLVGDQMGSHMIPLSTDLNPAHKIVELALGRSVEWRPALQRAVAIHRITMTEAGYFAGIKNSQEIMADPDVAYVNELGVKGAWYEPARSNQQVVGSVIAIGRTPDEAMARAKNWALKADVIDKPQSAVHLAHSGSLLNLDM